MSLFIDDGANVRLAATIVENPAIIAFVMWLETRAPKN